MQELWETVKAVLRPSAVWDLLGLSVWPFVTGVTQNVRGVALTRIAADNMQNGVSLLSQVALPEAISSGLYFAQTAPIRLGIKPLGKIIRNGGNVADYFVATTLYSAVTSAVSTGILILTAQLMQHFMNLSPESSFYMSLCGITLFLLTLSANNRIFMTKVGEDEKRHLKVCGRKPKICGKGLDGSFVACLTTLLNVSVFSGLSVVLVPNMKLPGFTVALSSGLALKTFVDLMYLRKDIFRAVDWERVKHHFKKMFLKRGVYGLQTLSELSVVSLLPMMAHWQGPDDVASLQIAIAEDGFTGSGAMSVQRGMQRQMDLVGSPLEKIHSYYRGVVTVTAIGAVFALLYLLIPEKLAEIFTNSPSIITAAGRNMGMFCLGQFLWYTRSAIELGLITLYSDGKFTFGASATAAAVFFGATLLPRVAHKNLSFDWIVKIYAAVMLCSLAALIIRSCERINRDESLNNGVAMQRIGLFKCCRPPVKPPEEAPLMGRQNVNEGP